MTEQELRKKIVEIVIDSIWKDAEADYDSTDESAARTIADALIAAGIGDVSEYERLKIELRSKVDYIHELWDVKEDYKHRAEVAEKQVYCLAKMFAEALCKNGNPENLMQGFIKDAKQQAEKELQEERKDE